MSPEISPAGNAGDTVDRKQTELDAADGLIDSKITPEQKDAEESKNEKLTSVYIMKVNDLQGRIEAARRTVEISKNARTPHWQELENACKDTESGLLQKFAEIDPETMTAAVEAFDQDVLALIIKLTGGIQEHQAAAKQETPTPPNLLEKTRVPLKKKESAQTTEKLKRPAQRKEPTKEQTEEMEKRQEAEKTETKQREQLKSVSIEEVGEGTIRKIQSNLQMLSRVPDAIHEQLFGRKAVKISAGDTLVRLQDIEVELIRTNSTLLDPEEAKQKRTALQKEKKSLEEGSAECKNIFEYLQEGSLDNSEYRYLLENPVAKIRAVRELSRDKSKRMQSDMEELKKQENAAIEDIAKQIKNTQYEWKDSFINALRTTAIYAVPIASPLLDQPMHTLLPDKMAFEEESIKTSVMNIERLRSNARKVGENQQANDSIGTILDIALTLGEAEDARLSGRTEESDRRMMKLLETYGDDLKTIDADLAKNAEKSAGRLRSQKKLSKVEEELLFGDPNSPEALRLAIEAKRTEDSGADIVDQVRVKQAFRLNEYKPGIPLLNMKKERYPFALYTLKTQSGVIVDGVTIATDALELLKTKAPKGQTLVLKRIPSKISLAAEEVIGGGPRGGGKRMQRVLDADMIRLEDLAYAKIENDTLTTQEIPRQPKDKTQTAVEGKKTETSVSKAEKDQEEKTLDIERALDRNPAIKNVKNTASTIQQTVGHMQKFLEASQKGSSREAFVKFAQEEAMPTLKMLKDPKLHADLDAARQALNMLRGASGVALGGLEGKIDQQLQALDAFEKMLYDKNTLNLFETITDKSKFTPDTWENFAKNQLPVIIASIVAACAAAAFVVATFGTGFVLVAAATAAGGVLGSELAKEAVHYGHQHFDDDVTSGRATFTERSRPGKYIERQKVFENGKYRETELLGDVVSPLAKEFGFAFATTLGTMGLGKIGGDKLSKLLQNPKFANKPVIKDLVRKLAILQKSPKSVEKAGMEKSIREALVDFGKEVSGEIAEEVQESAAEKLLNQLDKSLAATDASDGKLGLGSLAAVLLATIKGTRVGKATIGYDVPRNATPAAIDAQIQKIRETAAENGAEVTDLGKGVLSIRSRMEAADGTVTYEIVHMVPSYSLEGETNIDEDAGKKNREDEKAGDDDGRAALLEYMKTNDISDPERLKIAGDLLGIDLDLPENKQKRDAILAAHTYGTGNLEKGYSANEITEKGKILMRSGLTRKQAQLLLDTGVCGNTPPPPKVPKPPSAPGKAAPIELQPDVLQSPIMARETATFYNESLKILLTEDIDIDQKKKLISDLIDKSDKRLQKYFKAGADKLFEEMQKNKEQIEATIKKGGEIEYFLTAIADNLGKATPEQIEAIRKLIPDHAKIVESLPGIVIIQADETLMAELRACGALGKFTGAAVFKGGEDTIPFILVPLRTPSNGNVPDQLFESALVRHEVHHQIWLFLERANYLRKIDEKSEDFKKGFAYFRDELIAYTIERNVIPADVDAYSLTYSDNEEVVQAAKKAFAVVKTCMEIGKENGIHPSAFLFSFMNARNFEEIQRDAAKMITVQSPIGEKLMDILASKDKQTLEKFLEMTKISLSPEDIRRYAMSKAPALQNLGEFRSLFKKIQILAGKSEGDQGTQTLQMIKPKVFGNIDLPEKTVQLLLKQNFLSYLPLDIDTDRLLFSICKMAENQGADAAAEIIASAPVLQARFVDGFSSIKEGFISAVQRFGTVNASTESKIDTFLKDLQKHVSSKIEAAATKTQETETGKPPDTRTALVQNTEQNSPPVTSDTESVTPPPTGQSLLQSIQEQYAGDPKIGDFVEQCVKAGEKNPALVQKVAEEQIAASTTFIKAGGKAGDAFVCLSGTLEIIDAEGNIVKTITGPTLIGELSSAVRVRTASVRVSGNKPARMIRIPLDLAAAVINQSAGIREGIVRDRLGEVTGRTKPIDQKNLNNTLTLDPEKGMLDANEKNAADALQAYLKANPDAQSKLREQELAANETLVLEDESGSGFFLVLSGNVSVYRADPNTGILQHLATRSTGTILGEIAAIQNGNVKRTASIVANTPATIVHVPLELAQTMLRDPKVRDAIVTLADSRLLDGKKTARTPSEGTDSGNKAEAIDTLTKNLEAAGNDAGKLRELVTKAFIDGLVAPEQAGELIHATDKIVIFFNQNGQIEFHSYDNTLEWTAFLSLLKIDGKHLAPGSAELLQRVLQKTNLTTNIGLLKNVAVGEKPARGTKELLSERKGLQDEILAESMDAAKKLSQTISEKLPSGLEGPVLIVLKGNSASGKSSSIRNGGGALSWITDAVKTNSDARANEAKSTVSKDRIGNWKFDGIINPDALKRPLRTTSGDGKSEKLTHTQVFSEGGMLASVLTDCVMKQGLNTIVDKRFCTLSEVSTIVDSAVQNGYKSIVMVDIDAHGATSVDRIHGLNGRTQNGDDPIVPIPDIIDGFTLTRRDRKEVISYLEKTQREKGVTIRYSLISNNGTTDAPGKPEVIAEMRTDGIQPVEGKEDRYTELTTPLAEGEDVKIIKKIQDKKPLPASTPSQR